MVLWNGRGDLETVGLVLSTWTVMGMSLVGSSCVKWGFQCIIRGQPIFYVQSRWKAPTVWDGWFFPNPGLFRKSKFRIWWLFTLRAIGIKIERRKNLTGSTKKRNCLSFKSILILSFHQINKPPLHKLKCTEHWSGKRLEHQGQESGKYCLCVLFWEICHAHEWIWNWSKRT